MKVKFGKYKGQSWSDVPKDYLTWAAKAFDKKDPTRRLVVNELKRRQQRSGKPQSKPKAKSKQKHNEADWADTHYQWTGPTGVVEWIPNDVSMEGRESELAPV